MAKRLKGACNLENRQDIIDQNFYRSRYDAEMTLAKFSAALRRDVELERLSAYLLAAVQETVQPDQISLWLRASHGEGLSQEELLRLVDEPVELGAASRHLQERL